MEQKDLLVAYHGGGQPGVFWEWNFFSFDKKGVFHNIYTSGPAGIKTEEQAREMIKDPDDLDSGVYIYDLATDEGINDFQDSHSVPHVVKIVDLLNQGEKFGKYSKELYFICDECKEKITSNGRMEDWHGCGGVAMTADTKLCDDCYSAGCCSDCGEYYGQKDLKDGVCDGCYESTIDDALDHFSLENYYLLVYNRMSNTMTAVEELDISDVVDDIKNDKLWDVTIHCKEDIRHYLVDADSEFAAIDTVDAFLNGQYFTAKANRLTLDALANA